MNYEENQAAYWRSCDAWTFSEVQCLLDGQWPDSIDQPPSSLSITLIETGEEFIVINPMPHVHMPAACDSRRYCGGCFDANDDTVDRWCEAVWKRRRASLQADRSHRLGSIAGLIPRLSLLAGTAAYASACKQKAGALQTEHTADRAVPDAPSVEADHAVGTGSASSIWPLTKPKRFQAYGWPLYQLLEAVHSAGRPIPTPHEVLDAFAKNKPKGIEKVSHEELTYYDANNDLKSANVKAIRAAIKRMTTG